ncbi:acyl carrier protein [Butyrivibrio sp. JL13D10]|uniref:acyl carrier protein n=1 Tax=Butyrivibrio sp. JL13D10 TaxID=3236815 RepID=UPI0038B440DA
MTKEMKFKEIIAQYCEVAPKDLKDALRFREDLGFSSLDFMSFLGELEDEFDVELEQEKVVTIHTVGEAMSLLNEVA